VRLAPLQNQFLSELSTFYHNAQRGILQIVQLLFCVAIHPPQYLCTQCLVHGTD
jgi:hypothetical protein